MNISTLDLLIIVFYLAGILTIGMLTVRRKKMDSNRYFLAGRSLNWVVIGAALFASNISTIHLVGLSAQGFGEGMVWGNFEWMAAFLLIVLSLVFAPFYFKNRISTLPEYLEKRFSPASRTLLALIALLTALFAHIGISLYAGAVLFRNFFGIGIWTSIVILSTVTAIYTVLGGLKAVVVTETVQTVILLSGAAVLTGIALFALPGLGIHTLSDLKAAVKPDQMSMLQRGEDAVIPWYAILLGYPVLGIYYWCADQTIVQRVLGARSLKDAQVGPLFAGFIKILPVFLMVFPGVLAYVLFQDKITDSNDTLLVLISELLPVGMKGIMAAALMAALMSTIAAALNSVGTLVSIDIIQRRRPGTEDRKLVLAGRITSVSVMILAILWSPLIGKFESIFEAISVIMAMISPPVSSVFLLGALWKRGTSKASQVTLIVGMILGVVTFCFDFVPISGYAYISEGLGIHFMMQAWWLFVICSLLFIGVSLFTARPDSSQLENLTLSFDLKKAKLSLAGFLSLILIATMLVLYLIFA
jgi:SSS family solute:Na+ symporter